MKVVTWNCNMAFRKKFEKVITPEVDILIIQECESLDKLPITSFPNQPSDHFWYGDNPNKGIAVFVFKNLKMRLRSEFDSEYRYIIPLEIVGLEKEIILFAVWAQKPLKGDNYGEQVWNAIHAYETMLSDGNVIIAGDFNSNTYWDKRNREANHSNIVKFLDSKNIVSCYHSYFQENQSEESKATIYFQKKQEKSYHIDYVFVSSNLLNENYTVQVGSYLDWIKFSDHVPIAVNLL